ncbi:GH24505 [Drosophila grimshawi]|uniref:GH24505 n=1 Tax=Drosophila grimshawi TaxID=7222 RepID=B4JLR8_DROGR|nr:GH24505 [Drosophila grimshawi]
MSVDLSAQQEPTISVITTVPVAQNGGEMDALLLGRIGCSENFHMCCAPVSVDQCRAGNVNKIGNACNNSRIIDEFEKDEDDKSWC